MKKWRWKNKNGKIKMKNIKNKKTFYWKKILKILKTLKIEFKTMKMKKMKIKKLISTKQRMGGIPKESSMTYFNF